MRSVIEELFFGRINPYVKIYGQDTPFMQAAKLKARHLDSLMAMLNETGKETFEKYCDAQGEMEEIIEYDMFTYGLKFGTMLMAEVFMHNSEIIHEER